MSKRRISLLLLILFGLFTGMAMAEIILKFTLPERMFYRINISSTEGNYKLVDNPKLIYVPVPDTGSLNSYGHRGAAFPFKKGDKKRIVVMGDSVVEGLGIESHQRFTEALEKYFMGRYEIINLGVVGYSLLQEAEYFKLVGQKFSPDHVLWFITFNDMRLHSGEIYCFNKKLETAPKGSFYEAYYKTRIGLNKFFMSFDTYKLIKYAYATQAERVFNNEEEMISEAEVNNILQQLKILTTEDNCQFNFILMPVNTYAYKSEIDELKQLIHKNDIACLDLRECFKTYSPLTPLETYFQERDASHFSIEGNRAFAEILYQNRAKLGL